MTTDSLNIAVLTVSDSRDATNDGSGDYLSNALADDGHCLADRAWVADEVAAISTQAQRWIDDPAIDVVLATGGTGITARDVTPDALEPLFERRIDGFGELFRWLSYDEIGTSTIQSRAVAGIVGRNLIFCLPGSTGACRLAWEKILRQQLDIHHRPCNFAELLPRMVQPQQGRKS